MRLTPPCLLALCIALPAQTGPFGIACNTTALIPTLAIGSGAPKIGTTFTLDATWLHPAPVVTFVIGVSRTRWGPLALPFQLQALGRPDCNLYVSGEVVVVVPSTIHAGATLPVAVPNDPLLVGLDLFAQAADFNPGPGLAMTNGYALRIVP
jgi:hypothetical protein